MARDLMRYFRVEARDLLDKLSQDTLLFERQPTAELLAKLLRHAHTLKGAARVVEQPEIAEAIHGFEGLLSQHREQPEAVTTAEIGQLLAFLDIIAVWVARLEQPAVSPPELAAPSSPTPAVQPAVRNRALDEGGLGVLSYQGIEVDALLEDLRAASGQVEALRRNLSQVERGKTLGELLLAQLSAEGVPKTARFVAEELQSQLRSVERSLAFGVDQLDRELRQVQESTESLRLVRAEALFPALQRVLRDAAQEMGLQARLETSGGELRLDAQLLAAVQGALIQAVRNSLAHGIEPAEQREKAGKLATGLVGLRVSREGRQVVFRCRDDGRGVDLQAVRRQLSAKGVLAQDMDQPALLQALLRGGISTASTVTQAAGRGIGLDLVRETAARLGGEIELTTEPGRFTEIALRLPWTVAGMEFLQLSPTPESSSQADVLLPLDCVRGAMRLRAEDVMHESGGDMIVFEQQSLRLISLAAILEIERSTSLAVVVVDTSKGLLALAAGALKGARVASLLPLPPWATASRFIAGAVLNADGDAVLVLDPEGLSQASAASQSVLVDEADNESARLLVVDDSLTTRMLQQAILESAGFSVDLACSAEEGLDMARLTSYGLFLVDVEMPGMDGFSFIEEIRSDPRLRDTPAILVTSRDAPEDRLRGQNVGAQGYMVKSAFDQKGLLRQIRGLLR